MNRRKFLGSAFATLASLVTASAGSAWLFLRGPQFGALPEGERLSRILASPNYRDGQFQNLLSTRMMTGESGGFKGLIEFFFKKGRRIPKGTIPSVRRDLLNQPAGRDLLVWFGHSSYFLQLDGHRFLVDPVLSGSASPVPATTRAFPGTDAYTVADLPAIDTLILTHDHWDHMDYKTVVELRPRVGQVLCGLGVGQHLERWGYDPKRIHEADWGETVELGQGFRAHVRTARHFSGRLLKRNQSLWISAALETPSGFKVFVGGDGGYGPHFKQIGEEFGGFDLAMLENGQYDKAWRLIHMLPEETWAAAGDLGARMFFPVHNSKFCISNHDWDAPMKSIAGLDSGSGPRALTPIIGEIVDLKQPAAHFEPWWTKIA